jgi:hypothetical protein
MTQLRAQLCLQATHHYLTTNGTLKTTLDHRTFSTAQLETIQLQSLNNPILIRAVKMIGPLLHQNLSIRVQKAIARFNARLVG